MALGEVTLQRGGMPFVGPVLGALRRGCIQANAQAATAA